MKKRVESNNHTDTWISINEKHCQGKGHCAVRRTRRSSPGSIRAEIQGARRETGKELMGQKAPFQPMKQPHTSLMVEGTC